MRATRGALLAALAAVLLGCDPATVASPSSSGASGRPAANGSEAPVATNPVVGQLSGPWRRSPIVLDDAHIAILSDACAAAAREQIDDAAADLPTALIDAQGQGFAIAILADDLDAVECLVSVDETGQTATVDDIGRLSRTAVAPVGGDDVTLASVLPSDDGSRTIAFGRVGPEAFAVKVGFDDASVILTGDNNGWWATWWRGTVQAATYASVDKASIVIGSVKNPPDILEARVEPAPWWLDPGKPAPTATSTSIHGLVLEKACASGKTPEGRVEPPAIELTDASAVVTYAIRRLPGAQDCVGNEPFPVTMALGEKLGKRALLDGAFIPPRDATKPPD